MNIGVIGAGIVGLTTALQLQGEFRNAQVSILADGFNDDTTSWVAAGIFRPGPSFSGPSFDITKKWIVDAYNYWNDICNSVDASRAGVCKLSGYIFSKIDKTQVRNHYIEDVVPVYRQATEEELKLCNGDWKYGSFFTTLLTESRLFLPYAMERFKSANGRILQERVNSLNDTGNRFDVVFNCTGLGAKTLCNDYLVVPIRGQIIKVKAPWIKLAFYGDYDTYIIPGFEGVTLGGCRQYESSNLDRCKYDYLSIRERCINMLPSLEKAQYIREAVGLRPHRSPVRLESEYLENKSGKLVRIVHNYGHGGYGVTTAPGTAKYAIKILRDVLSSSGKSKL